VRGGRRGFDQHPCRQNERPATRLMIMLLLCS
jgi:hypothetical protein